MATAQVVNDVEAMLSTGADEPTSQELQREAWSLRFGNPRAALLLAVAAAEVGFKEMLIDLNPGVEWIVLHVQSPPIVEMLKHALPQLQARQGTAASAPLQMRKALDRAVNARNTLAHRGEFDRLAIDTEALIETVRLILQQFAYYRGRAWVAPVW